MHLVGLRLEPGEEPADAVPLPLPVAASARLAVPDQALHALGQIRPGHVGGQPLALQEALEVVLAVAVEAGLERLHGPAGERPARVGDHQLGVDRHRAPEALAGRAGADGVVEREEGRRGVGVGDVAARAVQRLAEAAGLALAGDAQLDAPLAVSQRALDRVDDPLAFLALDHDPVEHDRDDAVLGMEPGVLDADGLALLQHAPQPRLLEGLAHDLRRHLRADAVREAHERAAALGVRERVEDRGRRVAHDRLSALAAVKRRGPRVERAQVVGDGGHRADGRARGPDGRRAVDRDRREHALDPARPAAGRAAPGTAGRRG